MIARGLTKTTTVAVEAVLLAVSSIEIALKLRITPAYFGQAGATWFVLRAGAVLGLYALATLAWAIYAPEKRASLWPVVGLATGILEVANILIERVLPSISPLVWMVAMFLLWGAAAFWERRSGAKFWKSVGSAIGAAMLCMSLGVAPGLGYEFFVQPPDPAQVAQWQEFRRSGFTDARLFATANSLDSAFGHLATAPVVGLLMGMIGSAIGRRA